MRRLNMAGLAVAASFMAAAAQAAAPSVDYTAAQAAAGGADYAQNCAMCHGANLEGGGGPALTGPSTTVQSIFDIMTSQMPATTPGSLTHAQYEEIMAYILQKNGYQPGSTALSYDKAAADTTRLVSQAK